MRDNPAEEQRKREEQEKKKREEQEQKDREARDRISGSTPSTTPPASQPTPGKPMSGGGRRGGRSHGPRSYREAWRGWWVVNERALLPDRVSHESAVTTPGPYAVDRSSRIRRDRAITEKVLPVMHAVLDPEVESPQLMLRGALLALGRAARTDEAPALLTHWLELEDTGVEVREAAALGIGLLRRSPEERTLTPDTLDAIRRKLIRVVEDESAPEVVRATSAISLGLLGDQPFGTGIQKDGRFVTMKLWRNLCRRNTGTDLSVGLLTALGMQPPSGVSDEVRAQLLEVVKGRLAMDRTWNDLERGHALTALVQLDLAGAGDAIRMALTARRIPLAVRRAAFVALGRSAPHLSAEERLETTGALRKSIRRVSDPLTRGLASIAVGHLLSAQLDAGGRLDADVRALLRHLHTEARKGSTLTRGFAAVALGLAFRVQARGDGEKAMDHDSEWMEGRKAAARLLLDSLKSGRGDAEHLGAYAVGLGLMRARSAIPVLTSCVASDVQPALLRWDAAVALAQIGNPGRKAIQALHAALFDDLPRVRNGAAIGLSLLQGTKAGHRLLRELEGARRSEDVARLTEPLSRLVDPTSVERLTRYVKSEKNSTYGRASMLVALGNIADPERRSSLATIGFHANYPGDAPSLTSVLHAR